MRPRRSAADVMLMSTWRPKSRAIATVLQASRREAGLTQRDFVARLPAVMRPKFPA